MAGFAQLVVRLEALEGIPSRIAKEVATELTEELRQQFSNERDPYGTPWAPLLPQTIKRKIRLRQNNGTLRRSKALAAQTFARPMSGAGVEVSTLEAAEYHQEGTENMVARPVLPHEGDALPDAWEDIIQDASSRAFSKALR